MKKILFVLIFLFIASFVFAQSNKIEKIDASVISASASGGDCSNIEYLVDKNPKTYMSFPWANGGATIILDLKDNYLVNKLKIYNGSKGKTVFFLEEAYVLSELPKDPNDLKKRQRKLFDSFINLNHGINDQGVTDIDLPEGSVARYLILNIKCGGDTGEIGEIEVFGYKNIPERHLCWWNNNPYDLKENIKFLEDMGCTDIWLDSIEAGFPDTAKYTGYAEFEKSKVFNDLKKRNIRYWLMEHEAFTQMIRSVDDLRNDRKWDTTLKNMRKVYSKAKKLGFTGVVMDAENYSSLADVYHMPEFTAYFTSWSFKEEWGYSGAYYQRGLQVGKVIKETLGSKYIQLYEARLFSDKNDALQGNYWWLKGINDAGVDVVIAPEKSYGAGNNEIVSSESPHLHYWFINTAELVNWVYNEYPFIKGVIPGFHPWNVRLGVPMYKPEYLKEQINNATSLTTAFWIYTEGNVKNGDPRLTLNREKCKKYGVIPEDYIDILKNK